MRPRGERAIPARNGNLPERAVCAESPHCPAIPARRLVIEASYSLWQSSFQYRPLPAPCEPGLGRRSGGAAGVMMAAWPSLIR
jgi:hypothetical protein